MDIRDETTDPFSGTPIPCRSDSESRTVVTEGLTRTGFLWSKPPGVERIQPMYQWVKKLPKVN